MFTDFAIFVNSNVKLVSQVDFHCSAEERAVTAGYISQRTILFQLELNGR
jgi:hypothetical protein